MAVFISMLRGVNVGAHNRMKMDVLRALYESLNLENPRTYVQSGNVIFQTKEKNQALLAKKIQGAIEKKLGCCPDVILRTPDEFRRVIAANPFAGRNLEPGKILVTFLAANPPAGAEPTLASLKSSSRGVAPQGTRTLHLFPQRGRHLKTPLVAGRTPVESNRHGPKLEQRAEHAEDRRRNGRLKRARRARVAG